MNLIQEMLALQKCSDGFYLEAHPKLQPVDSATKGIFFAGCAEGPKDIKDSVTQASAAAARAMRLMTPGRLLVEAITAEVEAGQCTSCGICAKVCPYNAITVDKKAGKPAVVTEAACAGCGTCAAECPSDAIHMHHFTDQQILSLRWMPSWSEIPNRSSRCSPATGARTRARILPGCPVCNTRPTQG